MYMFYIGSNNHKLFMDRPIMAYKFALIVYIMEKQE